MKHQKTKRIIVLGRINTTLTMNVEVIPKPKEQVTAKKVLITPGGKGSNQAVAARRLGGKVSLVTCLGTDDFGKKLLSFLKTEGIDTKLIRFSKNTPAGMAIVILDENSENTIISIPGSELSCGHVRHIKHRSSSTWATHSNNSRGPLLRYCR